MSESEVTPEPDAQPASTEAPAPASESAAAPISAAAETDAEPQAEPQALDAGATVAVLGDPFAASGVIRVLGSFGYAVRVLCEDDDAERQALASRAPAEGSASPPPLETIRGTWDEPAARAKLLNDAFGVVMLSAVDMRGRTWRATSHVADVTLLIEEAEAQRVRQIVYLSTVAADPESPLSCLRDAAEAEKLIAGSHLGDYILRAAPLMGPGDELVTGVTRKALGGLPLMTLWGYGHTMLQPLHVDDLGRCVGRCFIRQPERLTAGTYAVAGRDVLSWLELMDGTLEQAGRIKLKVHIPVFALQLTASLSGQNGPGGLAEKLGLLDVHFITERNDGQKLLGVHHRLKRLKHTQNELLTAMRGS